MSCLSRFHDDEGGQGLIEYLLILALIALGAVAGMNTVASYLNSSFVQLGGKFGNQIGS